MLKGEVESSVLRLGIFGEPERLEGGYGISIEDDQQSFIKVGFETASGTHKILIFKYSSLAPVVI